MGCFDIYDHEGQRYEPSIENIEKVLWVFCRKRYHLIPSGHPDKAHLLGLLSSDVTIESCDIPGITIEILKSLVCERDT
jgi:hypothetical protein